MVTWNPGGKGMWIRPLVVEDAAWLAALAEQAFAHLDIGYGAAVQAWVTEPTVLGWAAEVDGVSVGFALASRLGIAEEGAAHLTELTAIAVAPEARRSGIARTLLAAVVRAARSEAGLVEIRLLVAVRNAPARALFRQAGFAEVGLDGTYSSGEPALRMRRSR
ncbi:MAG: GNAT family N-acetyltransferase [Deltaproteobacteria bacterium]|nr:GNAT family N-acetyltransferase [Deltaproteobacteria bacterium]